MSKKIICASVLSACFAGAVFAEAEVIDDSQNYAYNAQTSQVEPRELQSDDDDGVFVIEERPSRSTTQAQQTVVQADATSMEERFQLLLSKMQQMQQEIAELRGRLELQDHQLKRAGQTPLEPPTTNPAPVKVAPVVAQPLEVEQSKNKNEVAKNDQTISEQPSVPIIRKSDDPMDEQLSYVAAYELVKSRKYQQAMPTMQAFLKAYPDGPYAASAHYWLGELYLQNQQYQQGATEFKTIIEDFSDSSKLASARYKLGVAYEKLGQQEKAQAEFRKVTEDFPGTAIARLARTRIS
jgi:tol-pal system protein YbgF